MNWIEPALVLLIAGMLYTLYVSVQRYRAAQWLERYCEARVRQQAVERARMDLTLRLVKR